MFDRPDVSLGIRRTADSVVLVDRSCGSCPSCAAGATLWCRRPSAEGRDLGSPFPADRAEAVASAIAGAAALAEAPPASTVLVVDREDGPLAVLARVVTAGRVVGPDLSDADLRSALATTEPTGRAAVIVAGADARAAVKAVRRGGHVCVGQPGARLPSVTELVQREVTLVGPRDVAALVRRVGESAWAATVAAA
jgi:threonine dehydrogenase-like Zn-dependent dehydrogenase